MRQLESLAERATAFATREMLGLKNAGYLQPGEAPLTPPEFKRRLRLSRVTILLDGPVDFIFDDDDMLWGQRLSSSVNASVESASSGSSHYLPNRRSQRLGRNWSGSSSGRGKPVRPPKCCTVEPSART